MTDSPDSCTPDGLRKLCTQVVTVRPESALFDAVKRLGRKNSRWLGQYPDGAFSESATKQRILGAVGADGDLLGYLLFRTSKSYVTLTHLCVDSTARRSGVSHVLFEELKARTRDCIGVKLRCRRDFPASKHWDKLGFIPLSDRPGRSASGALLTTWFYSYGQPTLFGASAEADPRSRAVLDANILYDLQDRRNEHHRGIGALSADWLANEVEFCVTSEIYVEINRSNSFEKRSRRRAFAQQFMAVGADEVEERRVLEELRVLFPETLSTSDRSDLQQLAKSIAGEAQFFITWDAEQLARADSVRAQFGLAILRPMDLVIELDTRLREAEYVPARVAGCLTTITRMGAAEIERLRKSFQDFARAEPKGAFVAALHAANTDLHRTETYVVADREARDVALVTLDLRDPFCFRVPMLRIRRSRLSDGMADHLVWRAVTRASQTGHGIIEVTDPFLSPAAEAALRACDFTLFEEVWRKHIVRVCAPRSDVLTALRERSADCADPLLPTQIAILSAPDSAAYAATIARIERILWPVRITDTALPTYVVPIRPAYAAELFDEGLASQDLFGAKEHLALSLRNVYYRSARGVRVPAPARVLWYISDQKGYAGTSAIRAVSLVEETIRGPASELFRRFQRLGAYDWKQILKKVRGNAHAELEAFTFTHTELFPRPVGFRLAQDVLRQHTGAGNPFAGPVRIPEGCFADIYRIATSTENNP